MWPIEWLAPVLVTLNDLEGHSPLQAFSSAIFRTSVQYFTRFQLTARSRGPSTTAGLLVQARSDSSSESDARMQTVSDVYLDVFVRSILLYPVH